MKETVPPWVEEFIAMLKRVTPPSDWTAMHRFIKDLRKAAEGKS